MAGARLLGAAGALPRAAPPGKGGTGLQVFVRVGGAAPAAVELEPDATVADLREELGRLPQLQGSAARLRVHYAGKELLDPQATLADEGIGQEAVVEADDGSSLLLCWGERCEDWEVEGDSARRTRSPPERKRRGAVVTTEQVFSEGKHVWALVARIQAPGGTNFSIGLAEHGVNLAEQLYPQKCCWALLDHGDAYNKGRGLFPRTAYAGGEAVVFFLDMAAETCAVWTNAPAPRADTDCDLPRVIGTFTDIKAPVRGALSTLGQEELSCLTAPAGFGADIVAVPDWATDGDFLKGRVGWEDGTRGASFYKGQSG